MLIYIWRNETIWIQNGVCLMMIKGTYLRTKLEYHTDVHMEKGNNFAPIMSVFNDYFNILTKKAGVSC